MIKIMAICRSSSSILIPILYSIIIVVVARETFWCILLGSIRPMLALPIASYVYTYSNS